MTLPAAKPHFRAHALELHREFLALERTINLERTTQTQAIATLARKLRGLTYNKLDPQDKITGTYTPGVSAKALTSKFRHWKKHNRTPESLLPGYRGGTPKCPPELTKELQRRCTLTTGGRDKHGSSPVSVARNSIKRDWADGKPVPGLGTWQEWWLNHHPGKPLPPTAPDFPLCDKTLDRQAPSKLLRSTGNIGAAAAKKHAPYITLDYSRLRRCELYTLDDVRLDILCIDERTGRAVEAVAYILMECGSRTIPAWICKPRQAIRATDVADLLAHGLRCPGYGIGRGYQTHIIFERGTVACSEAAQAVLEGATDHRVKVHRTGMTGGIRWAGSPADQAVGNSLGKAVIESFNRRLHHALLHLPGQRGNNRDNQPANLGLTSTRQSAAAGTGNRVPIRKKQSNASQSLVREAEKLARIQIMANTGATPANRVRLNLPMLYFFQLQLAIKAAIDAHNNEPGHAYQGFGHFYEAETAPGVWQETDLTP